jgi:hypothetical protein
MLVKSILFAQERGAAPTTKNWRALQNSKLGLAHFGQWFSTFLHLGSPWVV